VSSREIRLHHERVVGAALLLAVVLPLYFLLTGFAVTNAAGAPISCASTIAELGQRQATPTDPIGTCHAGAVQRLQLATGYFAACLGVALAGWLVGGTRERSLNRAWAQARAPSRWLSTPTQIWVLAALLFVVLAGAAQNI